MKFKSPYRVQINDNIPEPRDNEQNALIGISPPIPDYKGSDKDIYRITEAGYYALICKLVTMGKVKNIGILHGGGALYFHFLAQYMLNKNTVPTEKEKKNLDSEFKLASVKEEDEWLEVNKLWCNFEDNKKKSGSIDGQIIERHPVKFHRTSEIMEHKAYPELLKKLKDYSVSNKEYKEAMESFSEGFINKKYSVEFSKSFHTPQVKEAVKKAMLDYVFCDMLNLAWGGILQNPDKVIKSEFFLNYHYFIYTYTSQVDLGRTCLNLTLKCLQLIGMSWININFHSERKKQGRAKKEKVERNSFPALSSHLLISDVDVSPGSSPSGSSAIESEESLSPVEEGENELKLSSKVKRNAKASEAISIPLNHDIKKMNDAPRFSSFSAINKFNEQQELMYKLFYFYYSQLSPLYKSIANLMLLGPSYTSVTSVELSLCAIQTLYSVLEDFQENITMVLEQLSKMKNETLKNLIKKKESPFFPYMKKFIQKEDRSATNVIKKMDRELNVLYSLLNQNIFSFVLSYLSNNKEYDSFCSVMYTHCQSFLLCSLNSKAVLFRIEENSPKTSSSYSSSSSRLTKLPSNSNQQMQSSSSLGPSSNPKENNFGQRFK